MADKNVTKSIIIGAVALIAVLFVVKALFFPNINDTPDRTITSTGTAELRTEPNQAEVDFNIEVLKPTAEEASNEAKKKSNAVISVLKSMEGVKVETISYNVWKKEDWTEDGSVFKGYVATYSLKATTSSFDNVGQIIDAAIDNGANGISNVQFTLTPEEEAKVKREALKKAGIDAKSKAEAIAEGVGLKLGDIVSVSSQDFYYPPIFYAKAAELSVAESVDAEAINREIMVEPKELTVTATISVVYETK